MNCYEVLLDVAYNQGLAVREKPLQSCDGRIKGRKMAVRKDIETSNEKACVLAEELGHYYTSVGDIINQSDSVNRKQERQARLWAYNNRIGLRGLIRACEHGCQDFHDTSEYLEVTEEFLRDCVNCYKDKYGSGVVVDNYYIMFVPCLTVGKITSVVMP